MRVRSPWHAACIMMHFKRPKAFMKPRTCTHRQIARCNRCAQSSINDKSKIERPDLAMWLICQATDGHLLRQRGAARAQRDLPWELDAASLSSGVPPRKRLSGQMHCKIWCDQPKACLQTAGWGAVDTVWSFPVHERADRPPVSTQRHPRLHHRYKHALT